MAAREQTRTGIIGDVYLLQKWQQQNSTQAVAAITKLHMISAVVHAHVRAVQLRTARPAPLLWLTPTAALVQMLFCPQAGFGHDYDCVSQDVPAYDHLIRVLPRCFTEVMLRIANPLRQMFPGQHKNGMKGEH
jgi:hypothetical protein